jgi:hypothetical protein
MTLYSVSMAFLALACAALVARLVQLNRGSVSASPATMFGAVSLFVAWVSWDVRKCQRVVLGCLLFLVMMV